MKEKKLMRKKDESIYNLISKVQNIQLNAILNWFAI